MMLSTVFLNKLKSNVTSEGTDYVSDFVYGSGLNVTSYMTNFTANYDSSLESDVTAGEDGFFVKNIKLLKAIVLCVVILIIIISTCRFVFKTFSRYLDWERKEDG